MSYRLKTNSKEYFINTTYQGLDDKKYILTGDSAFVYNGISVSGIYYPDLLTNGDLGYMQIHGRVSYCFVQYEINYRDYVSPMKDAPNILVPTPERAIVENIKTNLEFIDEGYFVDSLERFTWEKRYSYDKLIEVAEFFCVEKDIIDYWLEECEGFNSY